MKRHRFPVLAVLFVLPLRAPAATPFVRGDASGDSAVDIADPVKILFWLTAGARVDVPLDALDADDDGAIDFADPVVELSYLFLAGPPLPPPFPAEGFDPTTTDPHTEGDEVAASDEPLPDLAPRAISFDGDGVLSITFANEGNAEVPAGPGTISLFVDGQALRVLRLADLPDQSFRAPGITQTLRTDLRLAGSLRRVGVFLDSGNEIDELNEFQNTLTRTVTLPVAVGPDLIIRGLSLDGNGELRATLANAGPVASADGIDVALQVSVDGAVVSRSSVALRSLAAGEEIRIAPGPAVRIVEPGRVRVSLQTAVTDEIDNTNGVREATLPAGSSLAAYTALLEVPRVIENLVWEGSGGARDYEGWTPQQRDELGAAIVSLEAGETPGLSGPPALSAGAISASDAWQIYTAHVVQSLWVEVHGAVAWSLLDLPGDELRYLLDGRELVSYNPAADSYRFLVTLVGNVTAWSPRIAYEFLANMDRLRPTQLGTVLALTDWNRAHLIHTSSADVFSELFGYAGPPPVDRVLYALEGKRHKTAGCWGTSGLYAAVLRSVNIPVRRADILLLNGTHSRPEFVSIGRSMPHGDDPYNSVLLPSGSVVPSSELLYTLEEMETRFLAPGIDCDETMCNTVGEQASYNSGRDHWQLAYLYLSDTLLYQYAQYGPEYLDDSLRGPRIGGGVVEYARPYFTEAERAVMVDAARARLLEIGGGDLEEGKSIVRARYGRFGSNK